MVREHTLLTDAALDAARHARRAAGRGRRDSLRPPADDVVPGAAQEGRAAGAGAVRASSAAPPSRRTLLARRPAGARRRRRIEGLPDYGGLQTKLLIGGEWRDAEGGQTVPTVDPATNRTIVEVAAAQPADVDRAVARGPRRLPRMARPGAREAVADPAARRRADRGRARAAGEDRVARRRQADPRGGAGRPARLLGSVPLLPGARAGDRRPGAGDAADDARLRPQGADGRRRHDHPLELPAAHRLPQGQRRRWRPATPSSSRRPSWRR